MAYFALFDIVTWTTPPARPTDKHGDLALRRRGEQLPDDVPADQIDRLLGLGAIGTKADAFGAVVKDQEPPSVGPEQFAGMNVEDTVAYLSQHPTEARQIFEDERAKARPRKTVMAAAERIADEYEAAMEEQTRERADAEAAEQTAYENTNSGGGTGTPSLPPAQA